jgi:flagellar hook assembly protein FlgD
LKGKLTNPHVSIDFTVARPQRAVIAVLDLEGRLVVRLTDQRYGTGQHLVAWQGTDATGKTVSSGMYVVQIQGADAFDSRRITLVR